MEPLLLFAESEEELDYNEAMSEDGEIVDSSPIQDVRARPSSEGERRSSVFQRLGPGGDEAERQRSPTRKRKWSRFSARDPEPQSEPLSVPPQEPADTPRRIVVTSGPRRRGGAIPRRACFTLEPD